LRFGLDLAKRFGELFKDKPQLQAFIELLEEARDKGKGFKLLNDGNLQGVLSGFGYQARYISRCYKIYLFWKEKGVDVEALYEFAGYDSDCFARVLQEVTKIGLPAGNYPSAIGFYLRTILISLGKYPIKRVLFLDAERAVGAAKHPEAGTVSGSIMTREPTTSNCLLPFTLSGSTALTTGGSLAEISSSVLAGHPLTPLILAFFAFIIGLVIVSGLVDIRVIDICRSPKKETLSSHQLAAFRRVQIHKIIAWAIKNLEKGTRIRLEDIAALMKKRGWHVGLHTTATDIYADEDLAAVWSRYRSSIRTSSKLKTGKMPKKKKNNDYRSSIKCVRI
jgi:hypothetical protein